MQTKRIIIITLLISIVSNFLIPISLAENLADVEKPNIKIDSLKVDKTEATIGDTVTVSLEITDNSEVKDAYIIYQMAITQKSESYKLYINSTTGKYEAKITIDENYEEGIWKISEIIAEDTASNKQEIYNSKGMYGNLTPNQDLSKGNFKVTGTNADTEKPNINVASLTVDKSEVIVGNTVTISLKITDNIKIKKVYMYYETPITQKWKSYYLYENSNTGKYEAKITIDENYEEGIWKISEIIAEDTASNKQEIYNSKGMYGNLTPNQDLSKGNFKVTGTNADTEKPNINVASLTVDKSEVIVGNTVTISLKITDNIKIKKVYMYYETPITQKWKSYYLYENSNTGKYEAKITIDENYEEGIWKISEIIAEDTASNKQEIYNSKGMYGNLTPNQDLSKADFMVCMDNSTLENYIELKNIKTVDGVTVYKSNTTVSNQIINGDVYIGPEAVVTLSNVIVNGNIYVLGGARLNSITAKEVNARSIQWSSYGYTFYNGTAYISGNCSVNSMTSSTYPVQEIPYTIANNEINIENGLLNMKGATLDIADFYINDQKIDLSDDGKFIIKNMKVSDKDKVTLKWVTVFGNTITKDIKILKSISLPTNYSVTIGNKKQMQLSQSPSDALLPDNINWESSNKDVATVDENGIIEAKSIGETIITAKTQNGKTASCNLKVINYLLGDVNKDGKITLADYTKILAHVKKTKLLTEEEQKRADVNQDGKVTLADYTKVLAHVKKTKMLE